MIANTTSVSHGVPCWLAALFDLLKGVDVFESESKNKKIICTFVQTDAQWLQSKNHSYHDNPKAEIIFLYYSQMLNSYHTASKRVTIYWLQQVLGVALSESLESSLWAPCYKRKFQYVRDTAAQIFHHPGFSAAEEIPSCYGPTEDLKAGSVLRCRGCCMPVFCVLQTRVHLESCICSLYSNLTSWYELNHSFLYVETKVECWAHKSLKNMSE